jgi:exodeoxyribonuclease-3
VSFTVCSLNCNGLRAAHKKGFLDWLAKTKPDLLLLQEVRAWPDQVKPELRSPPGYNAHWVCAEKKGYSGVAVFSRVPIERAVVGNGLDWGDAEGRCLRVDFAGWSFVSLYVPSGSSSDERQGRKDRYLAHLAGWLEDLRAEGRPTVVGADWNIAHTELDIWNPKGNKKNSGFLPHERAWVDTLLATGWVDLHRQLNPDVQGPYSWWSNRGQARAKDRGWRLDWLLGTPGVAELAQESWVDRSLDLSDHAPTCVRLSPDLYRAGQVGVFPPLD